MSYKDQELEIRMVKIKARRVEDQQTCGNQVLDEKKSLLGTWKPPADPDGEKG